MRAAIHQRRSSVQHAQQVNRLLCTSLTLAAAMMFALTAGCGSKDTAGDADLDLPDAIKDMTAQQYLQSVFTRYHDAKSYRDSGRVRFSYQSDGRSQTTHAPLSVWFDRGLLYVEAYDVRLRSDTEVFTAWIKDPTTADYDSQVVRAPAQSGRPVINQLFADEVLNERVAAGLAGPPPQLEWLFASEPMKGLFADEHSIQYDKTRQLDGRSCVTINVVANDDSYRFWIDAREGVIRRVDLPPVLVPFRLMPQSAGNASPNVHLTLELDGATFQDPEAQASMSELPTRPKRVRKFIPLPPTQPRAVLGKRPANFSTRDQSGNVQLTHNGADRDITIIMFTQHAVASKSGLDAMEVIGLANWAAMMPTDLQQRVRVMIATDEPGFRLLPPDFPLPVVIDRDQRIQSAMGVEAGELVILGQDGRVAWVQTDLSTDSLARLGRIVGDVMQGIDVPARLRHQHQSDKATYESVLAAEVAANQEP